MIRGKGVKRDEGWKGRPVVCMYGWEYLLTLIRVLERKVVKISNVTSVPYSLEERKYALRV